MLNKHKRIQHRFNVMYWSQNRARFSAKSQCLDVTMVFVSPPESVLEHFSSCTAWKVLAIFRTVESFACNVDTLASVQLI